MINPEVGDRVKKLRIAKHYTREILAEKIDVSAKFIYDIEIQKKGFSANILSKLAAALDVSCDYIMYGRNEKNENIEDAAEILNRFDKRQIKHILQILQNIYEINNE